MPSRPLQIVAPVLISVPGVTDVATWSDKSPSQFTPRDFIFATWRLIFAGLATCAIWQALPRNLANPLLRRIGWWTATALALNTASERHVVASGIMLTSVVIVLAIWDIRLAAFARISRAQLLRRVETAVVAIPISLFAGWITVASLAGTSRSNPPG